MGSGVSLDVINKKLKEYVNSAKGKQQMENVLKSYVSQGVTKTAAGSKIIDETQMRSLVNSFIEILKQEAASSGDIAESVLDNISSASITNFKINKDGSAIVDVSFIDDLRRQSLYEEKYDGVTNIVALFNNGYEASNYVYGTWHGEKVRSKKNRSGSHFMQRAADKFNAQYGAEFNVQVMLSEKYY